MYQNEDEYDHDRRQAELYELREYEKEESAIEEWKMNRED